MNSTRGLLSAMVILFALLGMFVGLASKSTPILTSAAAISAFALVQTLFVTFFGELMKGLMNSDNYDWLNTYSMFVAALIALAVMNWLPATITW